MKRGFTAVALIVILAGTAFGWGVRIAQPLDGSISSVASISIMYQFENAGEVNPATIVLSINGVRYGIYDPQMRWSPAHLTFTPSIPFSEGTYACTLFARTYSGSEVENTPLATSFAIDLHGPYVVARELECIGCVSEDPLITTNRGERIIFYIRDEYTLINPNTVAIEVEGRRYDLSSPALEWIYPYSLEIDGEIIEVAKIIFDPAAGGIWWEPMDTVYARFYSAEDMPYYGSPNRLQIRDINEIVFYVDAKPPSAEILYPYVPEGRITWTSCRDQGFAIRIWDENGIDPLSVRVRLNDRLLTIFDPEVSFDSLTGTFAYAPLMPYSNGEEVNISLIGATDRFGNLINPDDAPSWSFVIDQTGPRITGHYPPHDYITTNIYEHVWFTVEDIYGVVDPMSIRMVIRSSSGLRFVYEGIGVLPDSMPEISWNGTRYEFSPELADTYWTDGDTIYVTVEDVADSAAFCGENHATNIPYSWSFIVTSGPYPELVYPKDGTSSSCRSQEILFYLHDRQGININSVLLEVEGKVYSRDSFMVFIDTIRVGGVIIGYDTIYYYPLSVHDSTVEFVPPENFFTNGQQVDIVLWQANDVLGNPLAGGPVRARFVVDTGRPRVAFTDPPAGGYVKGPSPKFSITIFDSLSTPVDSTTLILRVENIYYRLPNPGLHSDGTRIYFDGEEAGVVYGDQPIEICIIEAYDAPDYRCSYYTNPLEGLPYCYTINVDNTPPVVTLLEPTDGAKTACATQAIRIRIDDPAGIDTTSILMTVNGRIYRTDSPNLNYVDGVLVFVPPTPWRHNQLVHFALVQVADKVGNIRNGVPIEGTFRVDLESPVVSGSSPEDGEAVGDIITRITVYVADGISGVDYSTAEFTLRYGETEFHTTYDDGFIGHTINSIWLDLEEAGIDLNVPGLSVEVQFVVYDNVDYACASANRAEYTFSFSINPGWSLNLYIGENVLTLGGRLDASADYDDGIDVQAPPSEPGARRPAFVLGDGTRLTADYRALASTSEVWIIAVGDADGTLRWNPSELPETGSFLINGAIDMRTTNSFDFVAGSVISINYGKDIIRLNPGWNLVSVPVVPDDPSVEAVFPTVSPRNVWAYDATTRRYYNPTEVEPGKAYWVLSFESVSYNIAGTPLTSYTVRLPKGWNLIGSVYNFAGVDFTDPNDYPAGSIVGPAAYSYNPLLRTYVRETKLVAGLGYWVLVRLPAGFTYCELSVDAGFAASKRVGSIEIEEPSWSLKLSGGFTELVLGFAENASSEFDPAYDELLPPAPVFETTDIYLGKSDMRFARDITNKPEWHLNVSRRAEIRFETKNLPAGAALLVDDTEITDKNGTITVEQGEHLIKLVSKVVVPDRFVLKQNVPNPFNPVTTIEYGVPAEGNVLIEIYDMLGRKIRTLVNGYMPAGTHKIEWDGKDELGNNLPSGVYFYKMTAAGFNEIKKMTLLK